MNISAKRLSIVMFDRISSIPEKIIIERNYFEFYKIL